MGLKIVRIAFDQHPVSIELTVFVHFHRWSIKPDLEAALRLVAILKTHGTIIGPPGAGVAVSFD